MKINTTTQTTAATMVADARNTIDNLPVDQVAVELATGQPLLVDIREAEELSATGKTDGAVHAPAGCWSSTPTRPPPITSQSSIQTGGSFSTALRAAVRRWQSRHCKRSDIAISPIWMAASKPGPPPANPSSPHRACLQLESRGCSAGPPRPACPDISAPSSQECPAFHDSQTMRVTETRSPAILPPMNKGEMARSIACQKHSLRNGAARSAS